MHQHFSSVAFLALKKWGRGYNKCGAKTQGVCKEQFYWS